MLNRICKFYARGTCLKGEQCDFSHEKKDDICRYYQKGFCIYGAKCRYKHVKPSQVLSSTNGHLSPISNYVVSHNTTGTLSWIPKVVKSSSSNMHNRSLKQKNSVSLRKDVGQSSTSGVIPSKHLFCSFAATNCPLEDKCSCIHGNQCLYCRKFCLHPTNRTEKEDHLRTCDKKEKYIQEVNNCQEIECNICLERILSKPKAVDCKFGLLPECDHAFCLSCIRNWRNSTLTSGMEINNTSDIVRTCPVCRKLSYFVIPSGIWYSTKEEKQEIIDNYKANCKLIDCKHFNFGNGNCPFGRNCFYKHTIKRGSYIQIHHKPPPPPQYRPNNFDMFDTLDMLSDVALSSVEYFSIMMDSEVSDDMDPFEMMGIFDRNGSGPCLRPFDYDEEDLDIFNMAELSEALVSDLDDSSHEHFDNEEAAFISMMVSSNMEEEDHDDDGDDNDDGDDSDDDEKEKEDSDEEY